MPHAAAVQATERKEDKFVIWQIHNAAIKLLVKMHPINTDWAVAARYVYLWAWQATKS